MYVKITRVVIEFQSVLNYSSTIQQNKMTISGRMLDHHRFSFISL
jgi:hypothetical protein